VCVGVCVCVSTNILFVHMVTTLSKLNCIDVFTCVLMQTHTVIILSIVVRAYGGIPDTIPAQGAMHQMLKFSCKRTELNLVKETAVLGNCFRLPRELGFQTHCAVLTQSSLIVVTPKPSLFNMSTGTLYSIHFWIWC